MFYSEASFSVIVQMEELHWIVGGRKQQPCIYINDYTDIFQKIDDRLAFY